MKSKKTNFNIIFYFPDETSKKDLPTLLHFAARYNLKDFAATLLESPGARLAYGIENFEGHMPGQIAHKYGHNDLEEYLRTFMEFVSTTRPQIPSSWAVKRNF